MRGRQRAQYSGAGRERIEPAEALEQRRGKMVDGVEVREVERHKRGVALAIGLDLIVERFERLLRARNANDAPTAARELERNSPADPARCAGKEGDALF
jgi:hypothetical protein